MFADGLGDRGSILGRVLPKTQKMVLDPDLLNIQHYKVSIKGKVEQSGKGVALSPIEKGDLGSPSGHPWLRSPTLLTYNKTKS